MKPAANKASARRWVVKIGSALLTDEGRGLDHAAIHRWVDQMAALRKAGIDVVLVSSGSIVEGMSRLGLERRPQPVYQLQGLAAVGQMGLIQVYESFFQNHDTHTAQILMTPGGLRQPGPLSQRPQHAALSAGLGRGAGRQRERQRRDG